MTTSCRTPDDGCVRAGWQYWSDSDGDHRGRYVGFTKAHEPEPGTINVAVLDAMDRMAEMILQHCLCAAKSQLDPREHEASCPVRVYFAPFLDDLARRLWWTRMKEGIGSPDGSILICEDVPNLRVESKRHEVDGRGESWVVRLFEHLSISVTEEQWAAIEVGKSSERCFRIAR